jgi:hypothetical protein
MCVELKIKQKHLAVEPSIIKHEEKKLREKISINILNDKPYLGLQDKLFSLVNHRMQDVRNESRATHLARGFLKGADYKSIECYRRPEKEYTFNSAIVPRILSMVNKYGVSPMHKKATKEDILKWMEST